MEPVEEEGMPPPTKQDSVVVPFPVVTVRAIAKNIISTKNQRKGISSKAGNILSIAAGLMLKCVSNEVVEIAKKQQQPNITRSQLVDLCMNTMRYRFMIPKMKQQDCQPYLAPPNELSKRIVANFLNRPMSCAIPFIAPNPPGRPGNSEEDPAIREAENAEAIFQALSKSNMAYFNKVPKFFYKHRQEKN